MKSILIKTLSFFTGIFKYVLWFIIPTLKNSTANILKALMPITVRL